MDDFLEEEYGFDTYSGAGAQQEDEDLCSAFEAALEALLPQLLPNALTRWSKPDMMPRRPSPRWVHVGCPVGGCRCCCLVDMVLGFRQLAVGLAAAGVTADRLPPGPVREVLTRPRGPGGGEAFAAAAGGGSRGGGEEGAGAGGRGSGGGGLAGGRAGLEPESGAAGRGAGGAVEPSRGRDVGAGGSGAAAGGPGGVDEGTGRAGHPGPSGSASAAPRGGADVGARGLGPSGQGPLDGSSDGAAGSAAGGSDEDAGTPGREWVEWTDLPQWAKRALQRTARWGWFAGAEHPQGMGAYGSVAAHLRHDHVRQEEIQLGLERRLLAVPGGSELEPYVPPPARFVIGYSMDYEPAPDDPEVLQFAQELGEMMDDHGATIAHRRWGDGVTVFGPGNDVMGAYDSFKVGLRQALPAGQMPYGLVQQVLVSEREHFGRTCYHGWRSLPKWAQLGFIQAARWRWFDKEWHTEDPYVALRFHVRHGHAGSAEAARLQAVLMDRLGEEEEVEEEEDDDDDDEEEAEEEEEDTPDIPRRRYTRRQNEDFLWALFGRGKRPPPDGGAGGAGGGRAFRRRL
ncbi:hypothetical protein HYH03_005018 [Edaphochlamys debaryana]|uniref:Uncharacterized protein n=1 Tax=Edaphochlamys debaryana TaxID=47281 RepID=A0A835YDW9_9CHLO|nr:hypothetical protein HYH03_005018 [Edaphochlamys debaryana]|eukprot:KAG2497015.1 hypothetical protein HYH03_005018 [Edaphochlamys debaryana]